MEYSVDLCALKLQVFHPKNQCRVSWHEYTYFSNQSKTANHLTDNIYILFSLKQWTNVWAVWEFQWKSK